MRILASFDSIAARFGRVAAALLLAIPSCATRPPPGIAAVTPFDLSRYEGKWYEIARLDHSFERGLSDVSATYRQQADGSVEVVNRGYDSGRSEWRAATGRARFAGDPGRGSLEVSFFWPFYGAYYVVALDQPGYRWAMVMGPDRDYLWILARDRQLPAALRQTLETRAKSLGIDPARLIRVSQSRPDA